MARHARPRTGPTRGLLLLSLLLVLVGALVLGAVVVGRPDPVAAPSTARATPPTAPPGTPSRRGATSEAGTDWVDVLAELDAKRAAAFRDGDPAALAQVYADGSTALAADRRLLRRYARRGLRVRGLRMEIVDLRLVEHTPGRARLRVRDRIGAGRIVDADGRQTRLPTDDISEHHIVLVGAGAAWRVQRITPAGRSGASRGRR